MRTLAWPLWWLGVLLTVGHGLALGWLPTGTDAFDAVDSGDYLLSAGGYAATAVLLLLAATAIEEFDGPRNARRLAVAVAALTSFLALRAAVLLNDAPLGPGLHSAWDGAADVLATPWAWFYLVVGPVAWARAVRSPRRAMPVLTRTATVA